MKVEDPFSAIVADLIREGHKPKWIAYTLNERTDISRGRIAKILSLSESKVASLMVNATHEVATRIPWSVTFAEKCNRAFEHLTVVHPAKA